MLNCGSSSVKFQVIDMNGEAVLEHGSVQKIGSTGGIPNHEAAIQRIFGGLKNAWEIEAVGHRIVHGGNSFQQSVLINDAVMEKIKAAGELAPLHAPHNIAGYYASRALLPKARHVAVFDTAFHQTMPEKAYLYGLPYELYANEKIRRYGFHGTSHRYVSERFAQLQEKPLQDLRLISCHLGNGCSVCAIDRGMSVDTSMGLTPLEGLVMGTRSGSLDPGAVTYLMHHHGWDASTVDALLNEKSGLLGISGISNDMRDLTQASRDGNERASTAVTVFCYGVKKYIGAYLAAMNGADAVIFTGGIGENAAGVRAEVCASLDWFGIKIDPARNEAAVETAAKISEDGCRAEVWVIPTNEELLIARDTLACVSQARAKGL